MWVSAGREGELHRQQEDLVAAAQLSEELRRKLGEDDVRFERLQGELGGWQQKCASQAKELIKLRTTQQLQQQQQQERQQERQWDKGNTSKSYRRGRPHKAGARRAKARSVGAGGSAVRVESSESHCMLVRPCHRDDPAYIRVLFTEGEEGKGGAAAPAESEYYIMRHDSAFDEEGGGGIEGRRRDEGRGGGGGEVWVEEHSEGCACTDLATLFSRGAKTKRAEGGNSRH